MGFCDSGWAIIDGVVTYPSNIDPFTAYRFVLEAIYDGHLPVTRVIGYDYITPGARKSHTGSGMVERFKDCLEDRMTIASNLSKLLFLDTSYSKARTDSVDGELRVSNTRFTYSYNELKVISTEDYILKSACEAALELVLNKSTGFRDAGFNFDRVQSLSRSSSKTRYFPLYSYHNIIDFVRVLPPVNGVIKLHYKYGMNDQYLINMFEEMFAMKPDKDWLANYPEVLHA
jgi:hypothetical protein